MLYCSAIVLLLYMAAVRGTQLRKHFQSNSAFPLVQKMLRMYGIIEVIIVNCLLLAVIGQLTVLQ